jgi:hypothetical protein
MRISILGCGKRFQNVYYEIIKKMGHDVLVWNRTPEKAEIFCRQKGEKLSQSIDEVLDADLVLCFTPAQTQFDILTKVKNSKTIVLVETPAVDRRIENISARIGVLEQWPLLPLEQFKELIFSSSIMSRPYMVFNDGRSFDYHAMSQLRTYLNRSVPSSSKASIGVYRNNGVRDASGVLNTNRHEWTVGHIEMNDGSLLKHDFSYTCKSLLSIPMQFLRSLSTDGSIVTGRMREIGNDYEVIDVRTVDREGYVKIHDVEVVRTGEVTVSISIDALGVNWKNPYADLGFNDQQTAIASLLNYSISGKIYPFKESLIDNICVEMLKQSAYNNQTIKVT